MQASLIPHHIGQKPESQADKEQDLPEATRKINVSYCCEAGPEPEVTELLLNSKPLSGEIATTAPNKRLTPRRWPFGSAPVPAGNESKGPWLALKWQSRRCRSASASGRTAWVIPFFSPVEAVALAPSCATIAPSATCTTQRAATTKKDLHRCLLGWSWLQA